MEYTSDSVQRILSEIPCGMGVLISPPVPEGWGMQLYTESDAEADTKNARVTVETTGFDENPKHLVMNMPPRYRISDVMEHLKSQSSSAIWRKFKWLAGHIGKRA